MAESTPAAGPGHGAGANLPAEVDFRTAPERYRHWRLAIDGPVATLALDVDEAAGLRPGYELKLNSYDLGVDIELADAVQRLRFEHPGVRAVVITSAKARLFSAGANIRMLATASHAEKVNFCKFTNETRCAIEQAGAESGQHYVAALNGTASGGGYELALACERIVLADDGASAVSLPELPLLAVLPGTGGLTRLVDKRKVRRDRADVLCTTAEGVRGRRALDWGLVDALARPSELADAAHALALALADEQDRPSAADAIALGPLAREASPDRLSYDGLEVDIDGDRRLATVTVKGPAAPAPADAAGIRAAGDAFWPLALARALDDAVLHLRTNRADIGTWVLRSEGDGEMVAAYDALLAAQAGDRLAREVTLYWRRVLKRLDLSSRSLIALIEPGSCFAGMLLELALAADRSYMRDAEDEAPALRLTAMNFGPLAAANGLSRLATRFLGAPAALEAARAAADRPLGAAEAEAIGLVSFTPDDIDWDDEVRLALEERASFSPDALTGLEANLRFAGPETLETKIFGRLSAWQNWIFQRPNATGAGGALTVYGSGRRSDFDLRRV
ncbi:MAG TPA: 2,3-epoxybenzoyl-CoA dihydrolase [Alphaproteobacteria bacterium]